MIILITVVNIELPYYIEAPGGTINLSSRIDKNYNKDNGSLNMLYVTEYKGNIVTVLLSKIIKSWDLFEISNQQVSNEDSHDIYVRNKVMLDNSIQTATLVAYNYAGKKIDMQMIYDMPKHMSSTMNMATGASLIARINAGSVCCT